jgi:hypothetical protein
MLPGRLIHFVFMVGCQRTILVQTQRLHGSEVRPSLFKILCESMYSANVVRMLDEL